MKGFSSGKQGSVAKRANCLSSFDFLAYHSIGEQSTRLPAISGPSILQQNNLFRGNFEAILIASCS